MGKFQSVFDIIGPIMVGPSSPHTAGSAGCVPGVLFSVKDRLKATREDMVKFLFTTGAFGLVVANNAFISGAQGGCQVEVGSASAMAAAAVVEMAGEPLISQRTPLVSR